MKRRGRRRLRVVTIVLLVLGVLVVGAIGVGFLTIVAAYGRNLPDIERLSDIEPARPTLILARDGSVLARLYDKNRMYVPLTQIPKVMRDAIIANEDERFYTHSGVDMRGIVRAAVANYQGKRITQGASTITQQLARNLFLNSRQNMSRKAQEAMLAIEIERYYTKDEILERYLNLVYFGSNAYGVQAASHTYFGEDVSRLTLPQAAMLAGIIAAPSLYSPYVDSRRARLRQHHVLDRMASIGMIARAQAGDAARKRIIFFGQQQQGIQSYHYPYFTTYVIAELEKQFGTDQVLHGGLVVYTTLDTKLQNMAQRAVTDGVAAGRAEGYGMHQGALVAENPHTGEIRAMVGGVAFSQKNQFNRAWQARRQPGSSFKAYVYSTAIEHGMPVSSIYEDTPVSYPAGDGSDYSPSDDDHVYLGAITLRRAFILSRNVVAVKLAHDIGIDNVIDVAHKMGIAEPLGEDLSLALGTSVVSPLDMASGYSTIADGGVYIPPTGIRFVEDKYGSIVLDNRYPERKIAISNGTAWLMTSLMQGVIKEGTGYPNAVIGRPAAGKTGTTSDFRDAWFVGFTPQLASAVWVGNDDYSRMYESYGGNVPARIWAHFMKNALYDERPKDFGKAPPDLQEVRVCGGGTLRAPPGYGGEKDYFPQDSVPLKYCYQPPSETKRRPVAPAPRRSPTPKASPTDEAGASVEQSPSPLPPHVTPAPLPSPSPAAASPQPSSAPSAVATP